MAMTRVRPVWIPERVPARIACLHCGSPMEAVLASEKSEAFSYRCQRCGGSTVVSLEQLNDPLWRPKLMRAKAS